MKTGFWTAITATVAANVAKTNPIFRFIARQIFSP